MNRALHDAAMSYIESSPQWPVFPVDPTTKRPLVKTGTDHAEGATTDADTIRGWLGDTFPSCGIAMPTGKTSGTIVIDVDVKNGRDGIKLLRELEHGLGALPFVRVVRTRSGGFHIYLAHPLDGARVPSGAGSHSQLGKLLGGADGVDVRADGGLVPLPPTSGYTWVLDEDGESLPAIPALWLATLRGAGEPPVRPRAPVVTGERRWCAPEQVRPIVEGGRNDQLYRRGVALRAAGATDAEILDDLERVNALRCSPPLKAREVGIIAKSVARAS